MHVPQTALTTNALQQAYHLPLLVAFSQGQVSKNVWGGCMLLPASHFAPGGSVTRAWGDGAYSDDLILASLAGSLRRRILCPGCAVFPIHLAPRCTAAQAWNYLRRQTYVLDTYMFDHNRCDEPHSVGITAISNKRPHAMHRRVNHALLASTAYAAWALLAPVFATLARAAVRHVALHCRAFVIKRPAIQPADAEGVAALCWRLCC